MTHRRGVSSQNQLYSYKTKHQHGSTYGNDESTQTNKRKREETTMHDLNTSCSSHNVLQEKLDMLLNTMFKILEQNQQIMMENQRIMQHFLGEAGLSISPNIADTSH